MDASAENPSFFVVVMEWARISHMRAFVLLAVVALSLFFPGFFSLQPMDRDEPRFAQATKQMLETRDFVSIRFQDEARNKKPVGIYWLQAATVSLAEAAGISEARQRIWIYRLPSLAAALATVLLTYWAALAVTDRRRALIAGLLMASCLLLGVEARLAKTDATLTMTVVAAFGALTRLYLRRALAFSHAMIFWAAVALGLLVKGPLTPLFVLLAIGVLSFKERSLRWLLPLRPLLGLALCLIVVLPWFVLIGLKTHGAFFTDSVGQDMMGKVAQGQESHGAPPLTYFALFWLTGWPLAPLALAAAPLVWIARKEPRVTVLLAWLVPGWLMFELVPTKLPHYVLPLYPAIAILTASQFEPIMKTYRGWKGRLSAILTFFVPIILVGAGALLWLNSFVPISAKLVSVPVDWGQATPFVISMVVLALAGVLLFGRYTHYMSRQHSENAIGLYVAGTFCVFAMAYSTVVTGPAFAPFALSPRLAEIQSDIKRDMSCEPLRVTSAGYAEPSLVFLTQTDLQLTNGAAAGAFYAAGDCRMAFVTRQEEPAFLAQLPVGLVTEPVSHIAGINIGSGKRLDIAVYVRQ